ncbi:hypothetical protein [Erwinia billingiae]|uniref:hypothetical protein n=1 Tax=Erwinia billingiae TaxID=182337 RepID=UPI0019D27DA6|nr:hypothetical protein [Erwinia billingiae]
MSAGRNSNNGSNDVVKASLSAGSALLVAIIAAVGGTIGSYLTGSKLVESTSQPALINARTICINAVNEDEHKFRERASGFLTAIAEFDADNSLLYKPNHNQLYRPAKSAIMQAMSISSYSSERLSVLAVNIATSIKTLAVADMQYGASDEAYKLLSSSMGEWPEAYEEFMKTFDTKRAACNFNESNFISGK